MNSSAPVFTKFIITIFGIAAVSIAVVLLLVPVNQEHLQACANLYDEMTALARANNMSEIDEISKKYSLNRCSEKVDQWHDLTKYSVVSPT